MLYISRESITMELAGQRVANNSEEDEFLGFVLETEPRLRRALVAAYGTERGREATAEALGYAWEHRSELGKMDNPVGYLYRVAQSRSRERRRRALFERPASEDLWVEPGLPTALTDLPERQRVTVLLVYGAEWTLAETAALLGISRSSVQRHLERGLAKLRRAMKVEHDV